MENEYRIFKKGKINRGNHKGITILSLLMTINQHSKSYEWRKIRNQSFRQNRSSIESIYIIRKLPEKATKINKPLYTCFIVMTKVINRVKLKDMLHTTNQNKIPKNRKINRWAKQRNPHADHTIAIPLSFIHVAKI